MAYLRCPRCGLSVRIGAAGTAMENCHRCIAKVRANVPMVVVGASRDGRVRDDAQAVRSGPPARPALPLGEEVAPPLVITATQTAGMVVITLAGELDIASVGGLEPHLDHATEAGCRLVVIDLGGLKFLDSTGLQLLVSAQERVRARGQELRLRPGPPAVQRVFELTKTTELFRFEPPARAER